MLLALMLYAAASAMGLVRASISLGHGASPSDQPTADLTAVPVTPVSRVVHIVEAGDTVWSIARGWNPHGDIRSLVDRLVAQQHGRTLQPGDRLELR